jgi:hypothetical protein
LTQCGANSAPWPLIYRGKSIYSKRTRRRSRLYLQLEANHVGSQRIWKGMNSVGYEFITNSAPEQLGSGTLGCDASVAAGPRCRLAGPPLCCARPKERAGRLGRSGRTVKPPLAATRAVHRRRAGPMRRFRPTASLVFKNSFSFFPNLFIICKII